LELHHPALSVASDRAQLIELFVHAFANEPALFDRGRELVCQRALYASGEIIERVELFCEGAESVSSTALHALTERPDGREGGGESEEITRVGSRGRDLRREALEVIDLRELSACLVSEAVIGVKFSDASLASRDLIDLSEGGEQPLSNHAAAHGRLGAVDGG
jgi:hypothetical protein